MTTANPSHNPFRESEGRHAQAIHRSSQTQFPDDLPARSDDEESIDDERKVKREARRRVRQVMPPMPDLRFEQSYLLSIRPFLTPKPSKKAIEERGQVGEDNEGGEGDRHKTMEATEDDEVFHWGREVDVKWGMLSWVTFRDQTTTSAHRCYNVNFISVADKQLLSPMVQGALWGWAGLALSASSMYLRSALYPESHIGKGRIVGGSGASSGGGGAVGQSGGWWGKWVKSWAGGLEAATA